MHNKTHDQAKKVSHNQTSLPISKDNRLLTFDSGKYITFADGCHHTLVAGTTGCGKTMSAILPTLSHCIQKGCGGFVVDCKNNMTEKVKAIAKHHGREADIIELGSEVTAVPINIMEGMELYEIYNYINTLISNVASERDHNKAWHIKGAQVATDMAQMLLYIAKLDPRFTPSVSNIAQCMNDFNFSTNLFDEFVKAKKLFVNKQDTLQKIDDFIKSVKAIRFHIVNNSAHDDGYSRDRITFEEQTSFAFDTIRNALRDFLQTPGFIKNFCNEKGKSFCMEEALSQNKIVILRFSPATGPMGAKMARYLTERFYKAVYATGLQLPENHYSFVVLDEFQQFADLGDARFSDASFVAQAREFKCIFMAATQSLSALLTQKHDKNRVNQFVANCNNRILFYSDDVLLQEMAQRYDENIKLNRLENEVFVINFDSQKRQHLCSMETLQNAHDNMKDMLLTTQENKKFRLNIENKTIPISRYCTWLRKLIATEQAAPKPRSSIRSAIWDDVTF